MDADGPVQIDKFVLDILVVPDKLLEFFVGGLFVGKNGRGF